MNFFLKKTTWSNLEFIPLKLSIGTGYLLILSFFPAVQQDHRGVLLAVFIPTVIRSLYKWVRKLKEENPH